MKRIKRKKLPSICLACLGVGHVLRHADDCEQAKK